LLNLELIKLRNKPAEPPKAPPRAPFFLPTVHVDGNVQPTFVPTTTTPATTEAKDGDNDPMMTQVWSDDEMDEDEGDKAHGAGSRVGGSGGGSSSSIVMSARNAESLPTTGSRIIKGHGGGIGKPARSKLATIISSSMTANNPSDITTYLKSLSPPQIDLEMQALCLGSFDDEGLLLLGQALHYFIHEVKHHRDFEVVQAYLNRFLKIYSETLMEDPELCATATRLHQLEEQANRRVKDLTQQNLCLLNFLSNLQQGF